MEPQLPLLRTDYLTWDWLLKKPIWAQYYEDDSEMWRPVIDQNPLSIDCQALKIKTAFRTQNGIDLVGTIGVERALNTIYQNEIWFGDRWYGFNRHLLSLSEKDAAELAIALDTSTESLFPFDYFASLDFGGLSVSGVYNPFTKDNDGHGFEIRSSEVK